jgi:alginate O-acetyltransferase complex protein AlgI
MLFNSLAFLLFFPIMIAGFFWISPRWRWLWLLLGSCYFYMAFVPAYILILAALILVDYALARVMERFTGRVRWLLLIIGILSNFGALFVFKYFNFFNANLEHIASLLHWNYPIPFLHIALPLGLSFHTFQSVSYLTEVYRKAYPAERHLGIYALFVMFFPQLVAGPIERPAHMLPQFHQPTTWNTHRVLSGVQLMLWGLFKKVVIADRLALVVDYVYGRLPTMEGASILVAIFFFAFQLYCDFSGYSDIAVGSARVMGYDLTRNFTQPYFATSIADFWRRWHISLSSWLRDYLYFPLVHATRHWGKAWLPISLFITFLASGVWHGAGWNYVAMGALHGTYLVASLVTKPWRAWIVSVTRLNRLPALHRALQRLLCFVLVSGGWVFFRSTGLHQAILFFSRLTEGWAHGWNHVTRYITRPYDAFGIGITELAISISGIALLIGIEQWKERGTPLGQWVLTRPILLRSFIYTTVILLMVTLGIFHQKQFIYFQF